MPKDKTESQLNLTPQVLASLDTEQIFALIGRQTVQIEALSRELRKRDEIIARQQGLLTEAVKKHPSA